MTSDPAFRHLADVFTKASESGAERGAIAVMRNGQVVVDLCGGLARTGKAWSDDTLACCFSVTKGVLSLLAHVMIDRGMITADTRVCELWPGFAAHGKDTVTLLDVLTHRAGLPAVTGAVTAGDLYDWDGMVGHLERSAPTVPFRANPVYHNMTYGHLLGEILCRASGTRPLNRLLDQLVLAPTGADFRIGLGPADQARTAWLDQDDPGALFRVLEAEPETLFARSMTFFGRGEDFNSDLWQGAIIGSGSGHATARAIAMLYGQFIWPDAILSPSRQMALRVEQTRTAHDPILGLPIRYGQGIELSTPPGLDFGPNPEAVGHWGAGGAQGFADPVTGLSFGYVTGHMASQMGTSERCRHYVAALYDGL
jgi:CubicO group peptidase (beta-lactamase class C family)